MTAPYRGVNLPPESSFSAWMRNNLRDSQDPSDALSVCDIDFHVNRFRIRGCRDHQLVMGFELKTHGRQPGVNGREHLVQQQLLYDFNRGPTAYISPITGQCVRMQPCGFHLLSLSGQSVEDSSDIRWDSVPVTPEQLVRLLNMDLVMIGGELYEV